MSRALVLASALLAALPAGGADTGASTTISAEDHALGRAKSPESMATVMPAGPPALSTAGASDLKPSFSTAAPRAPAPAAAPPPAPAPEAAPAAAPRRAATPPAPPLRPAAPRPAEEPPPAPARRGLAGPLAAAAVIAVALALLVAFLRRVERTL